MIFAIPYLLLTAAQAKTPLQVVPSVDFNLYAGKWYEIARLPNRFQRDCASNTTATATLRPQAARSTAPAIPALAISLLKTNTTWRGRAEAPQ